MYWLLTCSLGHDNLKFEAFFVSLLELDLQDSPSMTLKSSIFGEMGFLHVHAAEFVEHLLRR